MATSGKRGANQRNLADRNGTSASFMCFANILRGDLHVLRAGGRNCAAARDADLQAQKTPLVVAQRAGSRAVPAAPRQPLQIARGVQYFGRVSCCFHLAPDAGDGAISGDQKGRALDPEAGFAIHAFFDPDAVTFA